MRNFQFIGQIDPQPLLHQLYLNQELWQPDDHYLKGLPQGPQGDVETIFLRFPPAVMTQADLARVDEHESVWMDAVRHLTAARAIINGLMQRVEGERLGRIRINKLRPGGQILRHADTPSHANYYDRYHAVLQSGPGCNFTCGQETVHMAPGTLWHFRNELEHEVTNNSAGERIHLIIDVKTYDAPPPGRNPGTPPTLTFEPTAKVIR